MLEEQIYSESPQHLTGRSYSTFRKSIINKQNKNVSRFSLNKDVAYIASIEHLDPPAHKL